MIKVAILTINDTSNFGNRLQNYALESTLRKLNVKPYTIENKNKFLNNTFAQKLKSYIGLLIKKIKNNSSAKRYLNFIKFEKNINNYKTIINVNNIPKNLEKNFVYFIVGSDQVWNPNFNRLTKVDLLSFVSPEKRISYAASFGINELPEKFLDITKEELSKFKAISVREDRGKEIVDELTNRTDVEVLIDPTMLLTSEEWDKVSLKPKMLKNDKFILNYFLGDLSDYRKNEIERIAKENNCEIINILDKNSPFYECGPSEFLWLEKNAFLICTDSFHSSVFAILYNRPFIIFDREQEGMAKMNSRLDTLISKFNLKNRKFEGKITNENLNHDYTDAYKILESERKKSKIFLEKALDVKK